jgi:hypothetical protein
MELFLEKWKLIEKFHFDLLAKNNMDRCPLLAGWFKVKIEEIDKLPDENAHSVIIKGNRLPVPKKKRISALYDITFKNLPLKEFCELMGVNYGTGRNWRYRDKIFQTIGLEFAEEYSHAFLQRYSEIVESTHSERFSKALDLFRECRFYPIVTGEQVMIQIEHYGKLKEKEKKAGAAWHNINILVKSHRLLSAILHLSLKNVEAGQRKYAQTLVDHKLQTFDAFYKKLRDKYKSPNSQDPIGLVETQAHDSMIYYTTIFKEFFS